MTDKALRFGCYPFGMEAEPSGDWVRASDLPPEVVEQYVQPYVPRPVADDDE